jgi:hypothetical protein
MAADVRNDIIFNAMHLPESEDKKSNHPKIVFVAILICAQIACASTASCVKALPAETPSALRGLWRQTLTSVMFSVLSVLLYCSRSKRGDAAANVNIDPTFVRVGRNDMGDSDEDATLLSTSRGGKVNFGGEIVSSSEDERGGAEFDWFSAEHVALVGLAVIGATLQNDAIVLALHYASSAAVMCLCNTSEFNVKRCFLFARLMGFSSSCLDCISLSCIAPIWLILFAIMNCSTDKPGASFESTYCVKLLVSIVT